MNKKFDEFYDDLERTAEYLSQNEDNEAIRHDLLIRPILISPHGLGWEKGEALSQIETPLNSALSESYYWRGAIPKKKRPDIILIPYNVSKVVGIVEEKKRQAGVIELEKHVGQLLEYQYLHRCVWGLLTDGEKWVLTKNHDVFHRFDNLQDLKRKINDLRHCIGRSAIVERLHKYGTPDLVYIRPSNHVLIYGFPGADHSITNFHKLLNKPTKEGADLVKLLFITSRDEIIQKSSNINSYEIRKIIIGLYGSGIVIMQALYIRAAKRC